MSEPMPSIRHPYHMLSEAASYLFEAIAERMDAGTFFVAETDGGSLRVLSAWNRGEPLAHTGSALPPAIAAWCREAVERAGAGPLLRGGPAADPDGGEPLRFAGVPIVLSDGETFGTVCAVDRSYRFAPEDLAMLEKMAKTIASFVEVERMVIRDELTGLYKRSYIEANYRQLAGRGPAAVAFIDMDDFKRINDSYGHRAGDAALRHVGATLLRLVGTGRFLPCRFGGDEFLVVFPTRRDRHELRTILEYLLQELGKPFVLPDGEPIRLACSIGVCTEADSLPASVDRADAAMYRAKAAGKRGIAFDDEPPAGPNRSVPRSS